MQNNHTITQNNLKLEPRLGRLLRPLARKQSESILKEKGK